MRRVGALIFPDFELLDVFGPLQMLGLFQEEFHLDLVAEDKGPVSSHQRVCAQADVAIADGQEFDVLLVPGGAGTRREVDNQSLIDWIAERSSKSEYTLGVCTGSALLARAGVLDGRKATTNKAAFDWVCSQGPAVEWVKKARWAEDGKFLTSSGVSAGIDMTLGAIQLMHDVEMAEKAAMWAEYTWHRDKDDDPFAALHGLA